MQLFKHQLLTNLIPPTGINEPVAIGVKATVGKIYNVTFQWEKWSTDRWENVGDPITETSSPLARNKQTCANVNEKILIQALEITPTIAGTEQYRCLITNKSEGDVVTRLVVYSEVEAKGEVPDPTPDPEKPSATFYSVTLPSVIGATLNPGTGTYAVQEDYSFSFTLTLDKGYDQSQPIVMAGNTELIPDANGNYTIERVISDLTITITGITLNNPTANVEIDASIKVWSQGTILYLHSIQPCKAQVIGMNGLVLKTLRLNGTESVTDLPHGCYIISIGKRVFKVAF